MGSKATATFTSQSGKAEALVMHGNFLDTTADIVDEAQGGKPTSKISQCLMHFMLTFQ
jgi:hypothetical protein